jgi:hypothetical protein
MAADSFAPGELAYLALTAKAELPLRDRLAWSLHSRDEWVVAREWKRQDLALLAKEDLAPLAIVQAKLMGLLDAAPITPDFDFRVFIPDDIEKARRVARPDTELYELLFAQHADKPCDKQWESVIKYRSLYQSRLKVHGSPEAIHDIGIEVLRSTLPQIGPSQSGCIEAGQCFGIDVKLYWWLIGPFLATE